MCKKIIIIIASVVGLSILSVALLGMYKFNYLASLPGYDVDGNKTDDVYQETEIESDIRVSADLVPGIKVKELEFYDLNPEFPGKEKVTYFVENGILSSEATEADETIWNIAKQLAPSDEVFRLLTEFVVYTDEDDTSDASMVMLDEDGDEWSFELNYKVVENFLELVPVLTHEFTHVLTLKNDQLTTESEDEDIRDTCTTYLVVEGCLVSDSYLGAFFAKFYKNNPDYQEEDRENTEEFFQGKENQYTTDYATTNPIEDIAEAFMYYASNDLLSDDTIKGQKVNFFLEYPELVEYRTGYRETVMGWE